MRRVVPALLPLLAWAASIRVEVRDSEVWLIRDGQAAQLTRDGKSKLQAVLSPSEDSIAYYEQCPQAEHCLPSVVVIDLVGRRVASFQPKTERAGRCGSILSIAWTSAGTIAAECHINPSLSEYIETEVSTGRTRRDLLGYWFTPSPDGKSVAHVGWIPHFAPPFAKSKYLQVDNTTIYPPQVVGSRGAVHSGIHDFMPGFAWAADSERIALVDCTFDWTDRESNRRCSLAVVSVRGTAALVPLDDVPPDQLRQAKLAWIDSHQLRLEAGGLSKSVRIP